MIRVDEKDINFVQFEASKINQVKKNELVVDLKQDDVTVMKSKVKGQLESKLIQKLDEMKLLEENSMDQISNMALSESIN
ncbi:MAG: hypothetical protein EZS28_031167 [Streblomastix strix]|uniref:Uncharacterized protein n=1 Tax=Streblomastix strix TaxID=222440 RepID=A0A5J4URJ3_9EUKA|nr:MAG: hypothetical protein EZS28_031167 [Streblomastix strix]